MAVWPNSKKPYEVNSAKTTTSNKFVTFTPEGLALVVRSGDGLLRRTRNLALSSLIEAVRDQTRIVDLKQVNRVLIQPHWRKDCDNPL